MAENEEVERLDTEFAKIIREAQQQPGIADLLEVVGQSEQLRILTEWYLGIISPPSPVTTSNATS